MKQTSEIGKLALRNILVHPVKSILLGLMILIAVNLFFITASLAVNSSRDWRDFFSKTFLGTYQITMFKADERDYGLPVLNQPKLFIPREIIQYLDSHGVAYLPRLKQGAAVYNHARGEFEGQLACLVGIRFPEELSRLTNIKITSGAAVPKRENGVLVWYEFANNLGWTVGDEITLWVRDIYGHTYPYSFIVEGLFDRKEGSSTEGVGFRILYPVVFAPYERLRYVTSVEDKEAETGSPCYTEISVWDPDGKYSRDLQALADRYHAQFFYAEKGFGALYGIVEAMRFVGNFIEVFTLLIIVISLFHLNLIGFFERKREIGTILALGAKPRWVIKLLLSEMLFLAAFGFVAAFFIYVIVMEAFSGGIDFGRLSIIFAGRPFILGLSLPAVLEAGAIIFLTILSSIVYPAYLATRIDPVEIFREGNL